MRRVTYYLSGWRSGAGGGSRRGNDLTASHLCGSPRNHSLTLVVPWYRGTMTTRSQDVLAVDRVQLGVRMERNLVKVLKGLAEFENMTLGQLLEKIVLHSFEPVPGEEGEQAWSALGKPSLTAVNDLKRVYGLGYDMHAFRRFRELESPAAEPMEA